jgi:uncharacterized MAPEG superfamily protein
MKPELAYLAWTALLTALLWLPYVLNRVMVLGLTETMGYPNDPKPLAPWAERAKKAHYNAVENLVVFGALVLTAVATNKLGSATAASAMVYFWARVVHYVVYTAGIPYLRTLSFTVGWLACLCIFWQILFA